MDMGQRLTEGPHNKVANKSSAAAYPSSTCSNASSPDSTPPRDVLEGREVYPTPPRMVMCKLSHVCVRVCGVG